MLNFFFDIFSLQRKSFCIIHTHIYYKSTYTFYDIIYILSFVIVIVGNTNILNNVIIFLMLHKRYALNSSKINCTDYRLYQLEFSANFCPLTQILLAYTPSVSLCLSTTYINTIIWGRYSRSGQDKLHLSIILRTTVDFLIAHQSSRRSDYRNWFSSPKITSRLMKLNWHSCHCNLNPVPPFSVCSVKWGRRRLCIFVLESVQHLL